MSEPTLQALYTESAASTWPQLTLDEVGKVLARCGLAAGGARLVWHSQRPLSAAAIVALGETEVFVKRHHRSVRTVDELREEHGFIRHLYANGAPVNRILAAPDGASSFSFGEFTYEVQERARGVDVYRQRASWTPFLTAEHAVAAGKALASLHKASTGYAAPARSARVLVSSYRVICAQDPLAALELQLADRPALREYLERHSWRTEIGSALAPFHRDFIGYAPRLEPLWTHNDWHASNLLWTDAGGDATVRTIVDFGLCDRTTAVYDLATAIERNTIPWIDIQDGRDGAADHSLIERLIEGYTKEAALSALERAALVAILPIVHVEYALAEIEYFTGVTRCSEHADLAYRAYLLRHCEWFMESAGRELLARLRASLGVQ